MCLSVNGLRYNATYFSGTLSEDHPSGTTEPLERDATLHLIVDTGTMSAWDGRKGHGFWRSNNMLRLQLRTSGALVFWILST